LAAAVAVIPYGGNINHLGQLREIGVCTVNCSYGDAPKTETMQREHNEYGDS
jgi:hypothetical protein